MTILQGFSRIQDKELVKERQLEIIGAAKQVFSKKGFHDTTVRDIATAANMTQGSLYNYVRSKDEILFLVCDHLISSYQNAIIEAAEAAKSPASQLKSALRALIEQMQKHQDDLLLIYQESHLLKGEALDIVLRRVSGFVDYFVDLIERARQSNEILCRNPGITANILTFLPTIVALRRWDLKDRSRPDELVRELVAFMSRGLSLKGEETAGADVAS